MALSRRALTQRKIPSDPQGAPSNSLLFPSLSSQAHSLTACFPLRLAAVTVCVWWKWWRQQRWWRWWCVRACGMCVTVHVTERGVCLCGCWRLLHCACWGIEGLGSAQLCSSLALSLPLAVWLSRPLCLWWNYRTVGVAGPALFQALVSVFVLNRIWEKERPIRAAQLERWRWVAVWAGVKSATRIHKEYLENRGPPAGTLQVQQQLSSKMVIFHYMYVIN